MRLFKAATLDEEYQYLRTQGYTGNINDMQDAYLIDQSKTGALADKFRTFDTTGGIPAP
jgi:hypothetical protein